MKKNKILQSIGVIAFTLMLVTSCKKDSEKRDADLTFNFQTTVNGNNYSINENYNGPEDRVFRFEKVQLYLSDITLIDQKDESCVISEIELLKFAENGTSAQTFKVPKGKYKSIEVGIGVKKSLNEADPSNYSSADHPLSVTQNTYWGWAGLYRFITLEGRYDGSTDGDPESLFVYHTGLEESYRTLKIDHEFKTKNGEQNTLNFEIDLYELLHKSSNRINVPEEPTFHGNPETIDISTRISDNMLTALTITSE